MDPLPHALTGAALSRAGLNRWCRCAAPVLVLAAATPDIDVVTSWWGSTIYLHYHRHLTHSLVMMPLTALLPLLPLLVVGLASGKGFDWKRAYGLALVGVASHIAIDWTNSYGVRPFLPLSDRWYHLDIIGLYDLWLWAVLLLAALAPLLARLVSSEIGARPGSGRGLAMFALLFFAGFGLARYLLHDRAVAALESRLYQGTTPRSVAAFPGRSDPFLWRGVVETDGFYSLHEVNLREEFDPTAGHTFYRTELGAAETAAWEAARRTEAFRVFMQFARYPWRRFVPLEEPEQAVRVEVIDLRFGDPLRPAFVVAAVVGAGGRVYESGFSFRYPAERRAARTPRL